MSNYYTTAEAADYLRYSVHSLRRFVRSGKLRPVNASGHPRFSEESLNEFLSRRRGDRVASIQQQTAPIEPVINARLRARMNRVAK